MVSCNITSQSVGVSESVSLEVAYPEDGGVTRIKAMILDADTLAPLSVQPLNNAG